MKKLSNTLLENVLGGLTCNQAAIAINVSAYTAIGAGAGAISCTIASAIYSSLASKQQSDMNKNARYNNTAKLLSIAGASLGGAAMAAATTGFVVSAIHGRGCEKCCIGKSPEWIAKH